MITLTIQCSRCSKKVVQDMTNRTLSDDLITKFGFTYIHNGKTNIVICKECEKQFNGLQERLENSARTELCDFFNNCGKEDKDGNNNGTKND